MWSFKCFSKSPRKVALEAKVQNISELNSGHSKKEPNQTETIFFFKKKKKKKAGIGFSVYLLD